MGKSVTALGQWWRSPTARSRPPATRSGPRRHDRLPHRSRGIAASCRGRSGPPHPRRGSASPSSTWGPACRPSVPAGSVSGPPRRRRGGVRPLHAHEHGTGHHRRTGDVRRAEEDRPAPPRRGRRLADAGVARMGSQVAEVSGTLGPEGPGYEIDKLDFYFKLLPDPSGAGLDSDPASSTAGATRRPVSSDRSPASASSSRHPWTRSPTSRSKRCCRSSTPRSRRPSPARSWSSCRRSG